MMRHLWGITCTVNRNKKETFKVVTTYKDIDLLAIVIKRYFSDIGNSPKVVQEIKYLGTVYE